jgi:hypothetical protein
MVVMIMLEDVSLSDHLDPEPLLSLQILDDTGGEEAHLAVTVKNLTMTGVILDSQHQDTQAKTDMLKGREGLLLIEVTPGSELAKIPGKILWTRNHEDNGAVTLGMEIVEPLPASLRHALEANMAIGAKDMKVLWDYWDEIQEESNVAEATEVQNVFPLAETPEISPGEAEAEDGGNWLYWLGFGVILAGLAMQLPEMEYLGFCGIGMMFGGSALVAWKSIMSIREVPAARPVNRS